MKKLRIVGGSLALVSIGFLAGAWVTWRGNHRPASGVGRTVLYWVDPMHPSYKSGTPGSAPDCGMPLEPVYSDSPAPASGGSRTGHTVHLDSERQQLLGVRIGEVQNGGGTRTLRTSGRVAVDPDRLYRVVSGAGGNVRRLYPNAPGTFVRKGEPLVAIYTSELLTAQQAYIYAVNTYERVNGEKLENPAQAALTNAQLRAAMDNLRSLGVSDDQLARLAASKEIASELELHSPVTGHVLSRGVSPLELVERGEELYRIADLRRVWVLADHFDSDAVEIRPGAVARVSVPGHQGATVHARVSNALPQFDAESRTLKIRLEAENADLRLRPDMLVDIEFDGDAPAGPAIPQDAVVHSGKRQTVFVDRGNGYFELREIETGQRYGDRVQVLGGLRVGERVVISGGFLLDSESRMKLASMGIYDPETDPVCGMQVDRGKAEQDRRTGAHAGTRYWFCSDQCTRLFANSPARYTPAPAPPAGAVRASLAEADRSIRPGRAKGPGGPPDADTIDARRITASPPVAERIRSESIFALDPVCGAEVERTDPNTLKAVYDGRTFYFFSAECKAEFERDRARYAGQAAANGSASGTASAGPRTVEPAVARTIDPVCGMEVDARTAAASDLHAEHGGAVYHFCSEACRKQFTAAPEKYRKRPTQEISR